MSGSEGLSALLLSSTFSLLICREIGCSEWDRWTRKLEEISDTLSADFPRAEGLRAAKPLCSDGQIKGITRVRSRSTAKLRIIIAAISRHSHANWPVQIKSSENAADLPLRGAQRLSQRASYLANLNISSVGANGSGRWRDRGESSRRGGGKRAAITPSEIQMKCA